MALYLLVLVLLHLELVQKETLVLPGQLLLDGPEVVGLLLLGLGVDEKGTRHLQPYGNELIALQIDPDLHYRRNLEQALLLGLVDHEHVPGLLHDLPVLVLEQRLDVIPARLLVPRLKAVHPQSLLHPQPSIEVLNAVRVSQFLLSYLLALNYYLRGGIFSFV